MEEKSGRSTKGKQVIEDSYSVIRKYGASSSSKGTKTRKESSGLPPVFFKILNHSTLENQELIIPPKFVKKFGNELSEFATITVPNGRSWKLGLNKVGGVLSFADGWQEFVEYYSLGYMHLILFKLEGFSKFSVKIFDKTATMVDYPCNGISNDKPSSDDDDDEDDDEDDNDVLEYYAYQQVGRMGKKHNKGSTSLNSKGALKIIRGRKFEEQAEEVGSVEMMKFMKNKGKIKNTALSAKDKDELVFITKTFYGFKGKKTVMSKETEMAFNAARNCKRTNPCFFLLLSKPNVQNYYADVPGEFAVKYMQGCSGSFTVEALNGKQWQMGCKSRYGGDSVQRISIRWQNFVNDNNLKEGDVCVFELINKKDVVLRPSIYRAADYAHPLKKENLNLMHYKHLKLN